MCLIPLDFWPTLYAFHSLFARAQNLFPLFILGVTVAMARAKDERLE